jgi:hypothetical protein
MDRIDVEGLGRLDVEFRIARSTPLRAVTRAHHLVDVRNNVPYKADIMRGKPSISIPQEIVERLVIF